jgi:hypothetical protein
MCMNGGDRKYEVFETANGGLHFRPVGDMQAMATAGFALGWDGIFRNGEYLFHLQTFGSMYVSRISHCRKPAHSHS